MVQSCLITLLLFLKSTGKYGFQLAHIAHYPNFQKFSNNFKKSSLKMPFLVIHRIVISSALTIKTCNM